MKELFLPVRSIYTVLFALLAAGATGFTSPTFVICVAILIFGNSFVFQYFVLHWALKKMTEHRARLKFLLMWMIAMTIAIASSILFLVGIDWTAEIEQIKANFFDGTVIYTVAAAAYVGGSMTRRAFTKHGGLG